MKRLLAALLILALLALTACVAPTTAPATTGQTTPDTTPSPTTTAMPDVSVDLMAAIKPADWPDCPAAPVPAFQRSLHQFAWALLQQSTTNPGNILVSPASVFIALAMTANGADGPTRTAMLDVLAREGLDQAALNQNSRDWQSLLTRTSSQATFNIANSIWYRQGFAADPAFLQANADYFAAGARSLDFNQPQALATINGWVQRHTQGKIDKIIERINPAVVMYLINTLYFHSDFAEPFNPKLTKTGAFQCPGQVVSAEFMHQTKNFLYISGKNSAGLLLPFADSRFSFLALLPPQNLTPRDFINALQATDYSALIASGQESLIAITLPRFSAKYSDSLVEELKAMGLGVAFDSAQADFSRMQTSRAKDLYISDVLHKTTCDVNEKGVEAAAATAVEISKTSGDQPDHTLDFSRPFIYGIIEKSTGIPLFIGIMEKPAAN